MTENKNSTIFKYKECAVRNCLLAVKTQLNGGWIFK